MVIGHPPAFGAPQGDSASTQEDGYLNYAVSLEFLRNSSSPARIGGTPVKLHLAAADADETVARAETADATMLRPVQDQMYGERSGMIVDPVGHQWFIGARIAEVSPEEMQACYDDAI